MPAPFVKKVLGGDEDAWKKAKDSCDSEDWKCVAGVSKKIHRNKSESVDDMLGGPRDFLGDPRNATLRGVDDGARDVQVDEDEAFYPKDWMGAAHYTPRKVESVTRKLLGLDEGDMGKTRFQEYVDSLLGEDNSGMTTTGNIATIPMGFKDTEDVPREDEETGIGLTGAPNRRAESKASRMARHRRRMHESLEEVTSDGCPKCGENEMIWNDQLKRWVCPCGYVYGNEKPESGSHRDSAIHGTGYREARDTTGLVESLLEDDPNFKCPACGDKKVKEAGQLCPGCLKTECSLEGTDEDPADLTESETPQTFLNRLIRVRSEMDMFVSNTDGLVKKLSKDGIKTTLPSSYLTDLDALWASLIKVVNDVSSVKTKEPLEDEDEESTLPIARPVPPNGGQGERHGNG